MHACKLTHLDFFNNFILLEKLQFLLQLTSAFSLYIMYEQIQVIKLYH